MGIEEQKRRLDWLNGEGLEVSADASPLDFLCAIFRDPRQPMSRRLAAAREAAPYVHATYKATALMVSGGDFAERLERAIERSRGEPKVIDHQPASEA
jgi:hypothetical protein